MVLSVGTPGSGYCGYFRGGICVRGPEETQLETDRRLINQRIKMRKGRLDEVQKSRECKCVAHPLRKLGFQCGHLLTFFCRTESDNAILVD